MEYVSMSIQEATEYQNQYQYLKGKRFTQNNETYIVAEIIASPSDTKLLKEFTWLLSQHDLGIKNQNDLAEFAQSHAIKEFTPLIFARKDSGQTPGHTFLPLRYLANHNGDLNLGWGMDFLD